MECQKRIMEMVQQMQAMCSEIEELCREEMGDEYTVERMRTLAGMQESKPSSGVSAKEKTAVVKAAQAGKDIGKPGKNFDKVAQKASKKYGSKEKGEKVAAAVMWKNVHK